MYFLSSASSPLEVETFRVLNAQTENIAELWTFECCTINSVLRFFSLVQPRTDLSKSTDKWKVKQLSGRSKSSLLFPARGSLIPARKQHRALIRVAWHIITPSYLCSSSSLFCDDDVTTCTWEWFEFDLCLPQDSLANSEERPREYILRRNTYDFAYLSFRSSPRKWASRRLCLKLLSSFRINQSNRQPCLNYNYIASMLVNTCLVTSSKFRNWIWLRFLKYIGFECWNQHD